MLLISIDPGETSGFVVLDQSNGAVQDSGALDPPTLQRKLKARLQTGEVENVVYEQFRLYGGKVGASKSFSDLPEVRIIGAITFLCEQYKVIPSSLPAGVYKLATAQWQSPRDSIKGVHMRDAWRLGIWFLVVRLGGEVTVNLKSGRTYVVKAKGGREVTHG